MSKRAIILMLDSVGIGSSPDAHQYGDEGANTLLHVKQAFERANPTTKFLPNLSKLGLFDAMNHAINGDEEAAYMNAPMDASNHALGRHKDKDGLKSLYGYAAEQSAGKDTPSGHWEMAGHPVPHPWAVYDRFEGDILKRLQSKFGFDGFLANKAASGTEVIEEFGGEHLETRQPILYTSSDSVMQIAAHEDETYFGLEKLYDLCSYARDIADELNIGRVIARPFIGDVQNGFTRTHNRRDWSQSPEYDLVFNKVEHAGGRCIGIGKISDIYAGCGITKSIKAAGNMDLFDKTMDALQTPKRHDAPELIMTNFVDFDMVYGHRRDAIGYANALMAFDQRLPELLNVLLPNDLVLITADHGCDPTWKGTDHTREYVPVIWAGHGLAHSGFYGKSTSFADMGQTIADYLDVDRVQHGKVIDL